MSQLPKGKWGEDLSALQNERRRALALFAEHGASQVEVPTLLPVAKMLDLYGEDIRARAYITHDPIEGDLVLRPDFTVPIVEMHMEYGAAPARYAYEGLIWRQKQGRTREDAAFWQVGYELFDDVNPVAADAELLSIFARLLAPMDLEIRTGDMGLIFTMLRALELEDWRRAALMRHIWRPKRFQALVERYSLPIEEKTEMATRAKQPVEGEAVGLRSVEEVKTRQNWLAKEAKTPPLGADIIDALEAAQSVEGNLARAAKAIEALAQRYSFLDKFSAQFAARNAALCNAGVDIEAILFHSNFGRESLEYYDGFVFGFYAKDMPELPSLAQGGRYDSLTRAMGKGAFMPAIGGIYRPEIGLELLQRRVK